MATGGRRHRAHGHRGAGDHGRGGGRANPGTRTCECPRGARGCTGRRPRGCGHRSPGHRAGATHPSARPQPEPERHLHTLLPHVGGDTADFSTNWSGVVDTGGTFTGVGGTWTVPTVKPTAADEFSASWVGIDGNSNDTLIQTGTAQQTAGGATSYYAWVELIPDSAVNINAPVSPGDKMEATVGETSTNKWTVSIEDLTANWSYTNQYSYTTPGASAEWIEEAPTVSGSQSTLADFGRVTFSGLEVSGSGLSSSVLTPIYMVNPAGTLIIAYPGTFNNTNHSFPDIYGEPPPEITAVSPAKGGAQGGTRVTIRGYFFTQATTVRFGSSAAHFTVAGDGTIHATAPAGRAGTVNVTVTAKDGTSPVSSDDHFTYTPSSGNHGYWLVGSDGGIFTFGSAVFHGSTGSFPLQRPVVGITPTEDRGGYWLVASDGGIFAFGDSGFYGSIPGLGLAPAGSPGGGAKLNAPIVGMVPSANGGGYFMVAADGGVFAFGNARYSGSCPSIGGCAGSAVAVMPDASGNGYWLVTSTGNVYTFGDATYFGAPGSEGSRVTSAVRTPDGRGYWVLMADGSVFGYGDAGNLGGGNGLGGSNPASAIVSTSDGHGYWLATADGSVLPFGDAPDDGSMAGVAARTHRSSPPPVGELRVQPDGGHLRTEDHRLIGNAP